MKHGFCNDSKCFCEYFLAHHLPSFGNLRHARRFTIQAFYHFIKSSTLSVVFHLEI